MLFAGGLLAKPGVGGLTGLGLADGLVRGTAMAFLRRTLAVHGAAIGQPLHYAPGTDVTRALVFGFSGLRPADGGQLAHLGMTAIIALGMAALLLLVGRWKGGRLAGWRTASCRSCLARLPLGTSL